MYLASRDQMNIFLTSRHGINTGFCHFTTSSTTAVGIAACIVYSVLIRWQITCTCAASCCRPSTWRCKYCGRSRCCRRCRARPSWLGEDGRPDLGGQLLRDSCSCTSCVALLAVLTTCAIRRESQHLVLRKLLHHEAIPLELVGENPVPSQGEVVHEVLRDLAAARRKSVAP